MCGGGKKFTSGGGNRGSSDPWIESSSTLSTGIFYGWGLLVYFLPVERVKGNRSLTESLSPDNPRARMMRIELNLVSRAGLEVSIAA